MNKIFKYCHSLLKNNFPKSYVFIYILFFILSFVQLFGTISIIPVITILVVPELIVENNYINEIYNFKSHDLNDLKVFFGLSFLLFESHLYCRNSLKRFMQVLKNNNRGFPS